MPRSQSLLSSSLSALVALAAVAAIFVVGARSDARAASTGPIPGVGVLRLGNSYVAGTNYNRYSYVIVGPMDVDRAAAQPGRSLVYKSGPDISASTSTSQETIPTGVSLPEARANGWVLRDSSGAEMKEPNWPYYVGDVGSTGYQQAWAKNVGDFLARHPGIDGVYIDNVLADIVGLTGGKYPSKYPNQQAWENAMAAFVAYVGPTLKARGFYVLANTHKYIYGAPGADNGAMEAQWWQRVGPSLSGLMTEYWQQNPNNVAQLRSSGPAWYQNWDGWQNLVDVAQNMGRDFVGIQRGTTASIATMRYGRASFLLDWNGQGGAYIFNTSSDSEDPWNTEWAVDIGLPAGDKFQVGVGWRRSYSAGTALVNPSASLSQTFSLGGVYLMPNGSSVTSITLAPTTGIVLRTSSSTSAPLSTAPPTISGTAQEGLAQASTSGTWSGSPTSFAYQWHRCDTAGGACGPITGATASQYLLTTIDVGKTVRAEVTASNSGGATAATSSASAVITSAPIAKPVNTALPTISGTAQQGSTFTASTGSWSNVPTSYGYQWQRCDSAGAACVAISGATASAFGLSSADVGKTLRVVVTASNAGGPTAAASAASTVVASAPVSKPVNTALPTISGTAQQGSTFTASTGSWSNGPTSYAYQWQRCDNTGAACAAISGATASSFGLTSVDVGKTLRVVVTASNAGGSTAATSAASAVVAPPPGGAAPINTAIPTVTGPKQVGKTGYASTGSWTGNPTSYAYQWLRCTGMTINTCVAITGATTSSYVYTSADENRMVIVRVTATNAYGSSWAASKIAGHVVK